VGGHVARALFAGSQRICSNPVSLNFAKSSVCTFRDIHGDISKDGVQEPCSSISSAFTFRAVQAKLGLVRATDPSDAGACPDGVDYTCPP
jgi:hypothetical protein